MNTPVAPQPQTLDGILKELCDHYKDDVISPGLQVAYLPESGEYYCGVHQFPSNVASRKVVAKAKEATSGLAMARAMETWRSIVKNGG